MYLRRIFSNVLGRGGGAAAPPGWWLAGGLIPVANCVAAYRAIGAASLAASYVNLANPGTYDITAGNTPTWSAASGWGFNGSASKRYLDTHVVPAANTWSMIIRYSDYVNGAANYGAFALAQTNTPDWRFFGMQRSDSNMTFGNGGNKNVSGTFPAAAVIAVSDRNGYIDKTVMTSAIPAGAGMPGYSVFIGVSNMNGSPENITWVTANVQALAIYNAPIDAWINDLTDAIANLA